MDARLQRLIGPGAGLLRPEGLAPSSSVPLPRSPLRGDGRGGKPTTSSGGPDLRSPVLEDNPGAVPGRSTVLPPQFPFAPLPPGVYNLLSIFERLTEFALGDTYHAGADRPPTP